MGEEPTRGNLAGEGAEVRGESGWVTTKVAAEALGVDPRTVRTYINRGELDAKVEGEGVEKAYLVSIDSVYTLRDRRRPPQKARDSTRDKSAGTASSVEGAEALADMVRELTADLLRSSSEATEYRVRLELSEQAHSSLEEELAAERARREQAEREREELRLRLDAALEARESTETASEGEGRDDISPEPHHPVERPQRSWWRKFFGFE